MLGAPGTDSLLCASPLPQSLSGLEPRNTEAAIQLVDPAVNFPAHFGEPRRVCVQRPHTHPLQQVLRD